MGEVFLLTFPFIEQANSYAILNGDAQSGLRTTWGYFDNK